VRVDGRKAKKGQTVAAGQRVSVEVPVEGPRAPVPTEGPLTALHVDDARVFVDKPAGVPVHPLEPLETGTVANLLVARWPEVVSASEDPREAGLVHRLDVETSGVLLVARTREAWTALRAQFGAGGAARKLYLALVSGPLADDGEIDVPLVQHGDHVRPALSSDTAARPALSRFRVLARSGLDALVEVQILTGVMHQVRAHLAGVGAPIVGDALYGGRSEPGLGRFFLHASSLSVTYPSPIEVRSPLPADLAAVLANHDITA
jgi:23S rRNA pseudouridine1911/1915/1917 synthase